MESLHRWLFTNLTHQALLLDLGTFLIAFTIAVFVTVTMSGTGRYARIIAIVTLIEAISTCLSAALAGPGRNPIAQLAVNFWRFDKSTILVLVGALATGAIAGIGISGFSTSGKRMLSILAAYFLLLGCFSLLLFKDLLIESGIDKSIPLLGGATATSADGFVLEKVVELPLMPTSVAVAPDGSVYVAGYGGLAMQNGNIVRVMTESGGETSLKVVASYLTRPHGIAFFGEDLYVSRAGQLNRAVDGKMTVEATGAVTRLRDLDGDHIFDSYHDIVSGLPGGQNPDGLHQNNGIAFDPSGRLFITVGAPSDHGPTIHEFAGTILTCDRNGDELEVFARGVRNPYDVVVTPHGIFCTDNDSNNQSTGDKVNLLERGAHFGFHYRAVPGIDVQGASSPWHVMESAQGIGYVSKKEWGENWGDGLLIASYGQGQIKWLSVPAETGKVADRLVASLPHVVDVVSSGEGTVYACTHDDRALYRIKRVRIP